MSDQQNKVGSVDFPFFTLTDDGLWLVISVVLMPLWMMLTQPVLLFLFVLLSLLLDLFLLILGFSAFFSGFVVVYLIFLSLVFYLAYIKPVRDRSWP